MNWRVWYSFHASRPSIWTVMSIHLSVVLQFSSQRWIHAFPLQPQSTETSSKGTGQTAFPTRIHSYLFIWLNIIPSTLSFYPHQLITMGYGSYSVSKPNPYAWVYNSDFPRLWQIL